jgi:hypothetical protein
VRGGSREMLASVSDKADCLARRISARQRASNLNGLGSCCARSSCIVGSTISTHNLDFWMVPQPLGERARFPIRQDVNDLPALQIHKQGQVANRSPQAR